jgi:hypothetical protein
MFAEKGMNLRARREISQKPPPDENVGECSFSLRLLQEAAKTVFRKHRRERRSIKEERESVEVGSHAFTE